MIEVKLAKVTPMAAGGHLQVAIQLHVRIDSRELINKSFFFFLCVEMNEVNI